MLSTSAFSFAGDGKRFPERCDMVTIKDVAREAHVAISTVSKVLNGYAGVSEETKRKVNEAIEKLNFVPNSIASALSSKQAGRIALLIHMSSQTKARDEIDMQYISGAIHQAQKLRLDLVVVFFSMLQGKTDQEILQYFQVQNIEGIIIYGMTRDDEQIMHLATSGAFKIVLVDVPVTDRHISSVGVNQKEAQKDVALRTLEENTSDSLLYISGNDNSYAAGERLEGIRELAEEKHFRLLIKCGDFQEKKARAITLKYAADYGAVVCSSDLMAISAMRALTELDIFRPVCGFDGLVLMGYAGKQMNTICQNFSDISARAVDEMEYLLGGGCGRRVYTPYRIERMKYHDMIGVSPEDAVPYRKKLEEAKKTEEIKKREKAPKTEVAEESGKTQKTKKQQNPKK